MGGEARHAILHGEAAAELAGRVDMNDPRGRVCLLQRIEQGLVGDLSAKRNLFERDGFVSVSTSERNKPPPE